MAKTCDGQSNGSGACAPRPDWRDTLDRLMYPPLPNFLPSDLDDDGLRELIAEWRGPSLGVGALARALGHRTESGFLYLAHHPGTPVSKLGVSAYPEARSGQVLGPMHRKWYLGRAAFAVEQTALAGLGRWVHRVWSEELRMAAEPAAALVDRLLDGLGIADQTPAFYAGAGEDERTAWSAPIWDRMVAWGMPEAYRQQAAMSGFYPAPPQPRRRRKP